MTETNHSQCDWGEGHSEGFVAGVMRERERIIMKFYALQVKARHESLSAEEKDWRAAEIEQVIREGTR